MFGKITCLMLELISHSIPVRGQIKGKTGQYGNYYPGNNLLPNRQIVHSTQQVVYLAHANMHTNHLLVYSGCHYCKQVL